MDNDETDEIAWNSKMRMIRLVLWIVLVISMTTLAVSPQIVAEPTPTPVYDIIPTPTPVLIKCREVFIFGGVYWCWPEKAASSWEGE